MTTTFKDLEGVVGDTMEPCTGPGPDSGSNSGTGTGTNSNENTAPTTAPAQESDDAHQHSHHVIFVVHGMGRQLEEYGNYERNVGYLVENIKTVLQSVFHELETDVHIIPIEWHAKLHSLVDDRMALASLRTVPKVRMVMNDYLADILYYFNGHFGSVMIRMIVDDLNEAYETFMAKHPDFNGKISVFALSLGGVAMYDILTCLDDDDEDVESEKSRDDEGTAAKSKNATSDADQKVPGLKKNTEYGANTSGNKKPKVRKQDQTKFRAVVPKLKFRPHYLFTVGSPVGAVMVMRNLEWESFHPPDDIIHHNLYHPFDPLGYRIEPLIDSVFAGVPALAVTSYNTVSSQQLLFPSISLPSLPSLLPESISSFWENKVPALPRPSIPTLSSLSQMTQSLKAGGRWLSGNGVAAVVESTGGVATPVMTAGEEGDVSAQSETATSPVPSVGRQEEVEETHGHEVLSKVQEEEDALVDVKVSATECITPATATAYLGCSDTAEIAGSPNVKATTPVRRLSLGPRRVSSRIEDNQDAINAALLNQQQHQERDGACGSTSEALPEEAVDEMSSKKVSDDPSPMEIEYYLGMETGATAEEKAQGLGAKSDVVQESMVRRPSVSPHEIEAQVETASKDVSQPKLEDIQTEEEEEDPAATANKRRTAVHVEGRRTCVPYRIDYVLQETTVDQYTNEYLLGMRSHFRYWGNRDVAYHILRTMLQSKDTLPHDTILHAKLDMPVPVTAPKGAREAAEAKAKAMAASARSRQSVTEASHEIKKQNRKSFTFSFFGAYESSSSGDLQRDREQQEIQRRQEREEAEAEADVDDDLAIMDEEGELFGYRYSDLDMNSKANVGFTTAASMGSSSRARSSFIAGYDPEEQSRVPRVGGNNKRRISTYAGKEKEGSSGIAATLAQEMSVSAEEGSTSTCTGSGSSSSVPIPELTRPAKLHHRSSRIEDK